MNLGMLFVSWPGHFQLLLFSNVYGKFILCLCSNHGTLEAHHCFTCIIVPISMHSFILWSLSAHLKSTIFNFPVLKIPASLEDSEFCQSFFFFHSDFSIIWVIYGWDKLLGAVSATTATIPQEIRAALSYSAYSFMFLMMESVKWFLQLTFFWLWPAVQWKPEAWCERAITLHLALWPLISWFNLQPLIFDGWNW